MTLTEEILSQLPGDVLGGLRRADRLLASLRQDTAPVPMVVKQSQMALANSPESRRCPRSGSDRMDRRVN